MRTKTLLLTAAISAVGLASSMAQAVYSVNYVGYVNKTLVPRFNLIANPLNNGNNQVATILPSVPEGTTVYRFNGAGYDTSDYFFGAWSVPDLVLLPGSGFFIANPEATPVTVTFVGEGMEGPNLMNNISPGLSLRSSKIPQAGDLTPGGNLEFPTPSEGDTVYKWLPGVQNYSTHTFFFGAWDVAPALDVAEAVFYQANAALAWERDFEVTP